MATRKQYLLGTAEQLYAWAHSSYDSVHHTKTCASTSLAKPRMDKEDGHKVPPLAKELLAVDGCVRWRGSFL